MNHTIVTLPSTFLWMVEFDKPQGMAVVSFSSRDIQLLPWLCVLWWYHIITCSQSQPVTTAKWLMFNRPDNIWNSFVSHLFSWKFHGLSFISLQFCLNLELWISGPSLYSSFLFYQGWIHHCPIIVPVSGSLTYWPWIGCSGVNKLLFYNYTAVHQRKRTQIDTIMN